MALSDLGFDNIDDFLEAWQKPARGQDQDAASEVAVAFHELRITRELGARQDGHWQTAAEGTHQELLTKLAHLGDVTRAGAFFSKESSYESVINLIDGGDVVIYCEVSRNTPTSEVFELELRVGAATLAQARAMMDDIAEILPAWEPSDDSDDHEVAFWSVGRHGAAREHRTLPAIHWDAIAENYIPAIAEPLAGLVQADEDSLPAKLHLWSGPPGTGKTHAVRALGSAWGSWCDTHYISDPEQFFGSAEYMNDVIHRASTNERWSLLILEDAGEFLSPDAPIAVGQGFSRLMNISDGMLGEGMRVILLLTTNTDIRDLHPAASRPGRAASNLSFGSFSPAQAGEWLQAHGVEGASPVGAMTLAELYAELQQAGPVTSGATARAVGFTA